MNLNFKTVSTRNYSEKEYLLQRANVTTDARFWAMWRVMRDQLSKVIHLQKEDGFTYAYRIIPKDTGIPLQNNPGIFILKDKHSLLPYQPKAVSALCAAIMKHNCAADGSDTGIGKTYVALSVCRNLRLQPGIVCKKAGIAGWKKACTLMQVKPFFIINWEQARRGKYQMLTRKKDEWSPNWVYTWKVPKGKIIIFDECHMANNPDSQNYAVWTAARKLTTLSLSATFADKPPKLQGLMYILGIVNEKKFKPWMMERTCFVNAHNELESLDTVSDMKMFNKFIYPSHGYRLSVEDPQVKPYFPNGVYRTQIVSIGIKHEREQNALYKAMLKKCVEYKEMAKRAKESRDNISLSQEANRIRYEALVADLRYRQAAELLKADTLHEIGQSHIVEGYAICIFVNFRDTLFYLAKKFKTNSVIYGEQDRDKIYREGVINDFQKNKSNIIISMVSAGGVSIDLHDLTGTKPRISLICPTYSSILLKQVLGRTRRAGSKSTPVMKLVYAAGTKEERVAEVVNQKLDNISALNDGDLMESDLFNLGIRSTDRKIEK